MTDDLQATLYQELKGDLLKLYGPVIGGQDLAQALGFKSLKALRQAKSRDLLGVSVFTPPKRRGLYAMTSEVAEWIINQRFEGGGADKNKINGSR